MSFRPMLCPHASFDVTCFPSLVGASDVVLRTIFYTLHISLQSLCQFTSNPGNCVVCCRRGLGNVHRVRADCHLLQHDHRLHHLLPVCFLQGHAALGRVWRLELTWYGYLLLLSARLVQCHHTVCSRIVVKFNIWSVPCSCLVRWVYCVWIKLFYFLPAVTQFDH